MHLEKLIFIAFVFTGLCPPDIHGNDAPIQATGKTVMPRTDVPVRLVSEEVIITIDNGVAYVRCYFDLLNEGPKDTIDVGFPRGWEGELYDFTAEIKGHGK